MDRARSFRHRTELQLHPFTADLALHRQQFRQLGIKPVAFHGIPDNTRPAHKKGKDDSQAEFQEDNHRASSPARDIEDRILLPPVGEIMLHHSAKKRKLSHPKGFDSPRRNMVIRNHRDISQTKQIIIDHSPFSYSSSSLSEPESDSGGSEELLKEEKQKLKKKLHGIFPGSYIFQSVDLEEHRRKEYKHHRQLDAANRKGVAKKKKGKAKDFNLLNFPGDDESDVEDSMQIIEISDTEESLRDPDPIDRMYTRSSPNASYKPKKSGKQIKLPFSFVNSAQTTLKRKSGPSNPRSCVRKVRTLPSIVDVCNVHQALTNTRPPDFLRIARKTAQKYPNAGQRARIGKRLFFEDDDDNQQVLQVIREWKKGRISGIKPAKAKSRAPIQKNHANAKERTSPSISNEDVLGIDVSRPMPRAQSPQKKSPRKPYFVLRTQAQPIKQRPRYRTAQPEVETGEYVLRPGYKRLVRTKTSHEIEQIRSCLAQQAQGQQARITEPHKSSRPTNSTSRLQRKHKSSRINRDRYDEVFREEIRKLPESHEFGATNRGSLSTFSLSSDRQTTSKRQVLLTDFLVPSKSYTRSFNVVPVSTGTRFDASTFIGSGGLAAVLSGAKQNYGYEANFCEIFGIVLDIQDASKNLPEYASTIFSKIIDVSQSSGVGHDISPCYNFFRWLVKCNNHVMARLNFEETENFIRSMLATIETLLDGMVSIVQDENLDYQNGSVKLCLQASMFASIWAYQYADMLLKIKSDSLGPQHAMIQNTKRQLRNLIKIGLEAVDDGFRKQRAHLDRAITTDLYQIELWVVLLHITDGSNLKFKNTTLFWPLLNSSFLIFQEKDRLITYELIWYLVMNICRLYQFDQYGVALEPHGPDNWAMLERLVKVVLISAPPFKADSSSIEVSTFAEYLKTLIGRCHNLVYHWGWANAKNITIMFFEFFSKRKFENIEVEEHLHPPEFLRSLDKEPSLEIETSDTAFHIVLKLAAMLLRDTVKAGKKGPTNNLVSRLKPLNSRQYPRHQPFEVIHYVSLMNHHSILILLYWLTPSYCRPTLEMIRDTVKASESHVKTLEISLHAWKSISRLVISRNENVLCLSDWMVTLLDGTRTEYVKLHRAANWKERDMEGDLTKHEEQVEHNLKQFADVIMLGLEVFEDLLKSQVIRDDPMKVFVLPLRVALFNVFTTAVDLSEDIKLLSLRILSSLISLDNESGGVPIQPLRTPAIERSGVREESQDYDGDFFDDIDVDEIMGLPSKATFGSRLAQFINDDVIQGLGQMAASCLARDNRSSEKLIRETLTLWIRSTKVLVVQKFRDLSTFFGLGQESWDRLSHTPLKKKWNTFFLVEVARQNPSILLVCKDQYLSAWFSEIVQPKVTSQHHLTNFLLNTFPLIDPMFNNPPIAREIDQQFHVTAQDLSSVRSAVITRILIIISSLTCRYTLEYWRRF
ncbi:hypothetical protein NEOLI_002702 [Neolecta irregularis DAH-3]|uniref:Protein mms22 n=1 Tax=Neolecta irregularis (strain DAH-3) TaxID=1198029 RepID=A0A1U7LIE6_NEOID|nr:hypothetical protein NEOLI_002702 [Neolecta irregularis DAH-3]|eukprot:OLL22301.1 hypothetical protein NEOLI_002702 [Neolecta irregularis DAH-3]